MATGSQWGITPRQSIERECARRGRAAVVQGCRDLLKGQPVDPELLLSLGGPAAQPFLDQEGREDAYWLRVWGARGLLWAWDDVATVEVKHALEDESWRVREMAIKVSARHLLGDLAADVAVLRTDAVARVRHAAERALVVLTANSA
jgi:hypothetical protein